ncbi:DUF3325 domain-containing protein [Altericroceibacterium spongiae]|uniref:DUF3325 domain-containing protein n=1 Tax=Altericroceibacterium spongiae TaxID=2320269 RepID=A0A420EE49_9SPHN|nr:DUF3325 domain-containing protein [Altericroceibacterium spongiae]RKF18934.1 DUF3325 domain-containing protein [Altericroceibacterium spongiae]
MTGLLFILCVIAFGFFGLADKKHHQTRFEQRPSPERSHRMRRIGWILLAFSFPVSIAAEGWIYGPVLWSGMVMCSAGVVFLMLNFLPETVKWLDPGHKE